MKHENHLLLITDAWFPQTSGVVTTLSEVLSRLKERKWNVEVIHPGLFKSIAMPRYSMIRLVWEIRKAKLEIDRAISRLSVKAYSGHACHIHIAVEGPLGIIARRLCKRLKLNYTTAYHTNFPDYAEKIYKIPKSFVIPFIRWFHKHSSMVLVPSQATAERLYDYRIPNTRIWSRGYNEEIFMPGSRSPTDQLQNLLYVGRVSEEKNIQDFMLLQSQHRKLTVVGDGPSLEKLKSQNPNVDFVGFKFGEELASYYQNADVFVFPSKTDTLGVVMIEAIACGTPVAAYPVEGPIEIIRNGVNGYLKNDLNVAVEKALWLNRHKVHQSSKHLSWDKTTQTFVETLIRIS